MNTEKVKNALILLLVILNVAVFLLASIDNRRYILSSSEEKAISALLKRNNIFLYAPIVKEFQPLKRLDCQPAVYDNKKIASYFMGSQYETTDRAYYEHGKATLEFGEDNVFGYANPAGFVSEGFGRTPFSKTSAELFAMEIMKEILPEGLEFKLYTTLEKNGGYSFDYRGRFGSSIVYSNYFRVTIDTDGLKSLRCAYVIPTGFSGEPRDIHTSAEALAAFVNQINFLYEESLEVGINHMGLAYYLPGANSMDNGSLWAEPCYVINASISGARGVSVNFVIDAITNKVVQ